MTKEKAKDFVSRQKEIMENETPFRRKFIAWSASITAILSFGISIFWLVRADSANMMDDDFIPIEEATGAKID